jgi:hypothetical protein
MQGSSGQKAIIERVIQELSVKLKLISVKFHGFSFRKKLIVPGGDDRKNYCLMRVKITFKEKGAVVSKNVIIYPCDVVPYVRKSLDVIEEMVRGKLQKGQSYLQAGDLFYKKYNLSINSIKSAVRMAEKAFSKLLSCDLIEGFDLVFWISCEKRNFAYLNHLYREELLRRNIFADNLFR